MNIKEIKEKLNLKWVVEKDAEIKNGFACDLLSVVIANCPEDAVWLTVQGHKNVIAVAKMTDTKAIIVCCDAPVEEDAIQAAQKEDIALLKTSDGIFTIAGKLWEIGIR